MKSTISDIVRLTLESVKKNKNLYKFENYNFTQAAIRYFSGKYRISSNYKSQEKKNYFYYIFELGHFLKVIFLFFYTRKIDGIIYANTKYKLNICRKIFNSSDFKIIYFKKNFNYTPFSDLYFISIFFFYFFKKKNNSYFINRLILLRKILDFYKPKFFFSLEGDSVDEAIFAQVCKKKKIPYFCLQHGINSPFILNKNSKYKYKNFFYDFIYLTTSELHAKYLKKIKLVKNYVLIKNKTFKPKKIKQNLLVCINSVGEKNNIHPTRQIFKTLEYVSICAKNLPNTKIFVRLHPSQNSNKLVYNYFNNNKFFKNIIIQNPDKIDIVSAFETCLVAFFYAGSSLLIDAIKNSVIPIVLEESEVLYNLSFLKKKKVLLTSKTLNSCFNLTLKIMQKSFFRSKIEKNITNFNSIYFQNNNSKNILDVINDYTKYNNLKGF